MQDRHSHHKLLLTPYRQALYQADWTSLAQQMNYLFDPDIQIHLSFPFETMTGGQAFQAQALDPLHMAWPDLERRDYIVMAGADRGRDLVGCGGYYTGSFMKPWLGIPPTGHQVAMRFAEFYFFEGDRITEIQAIWDLPEVMMQANVWPMAPSLGREWHVPGPASQNGLVDGPYQPARAEASRHLVCSMLEGLGRHATEGAAAMGLEQYWHPHMSWYGPSAIGTARGIRGFRNWHQIPFLKAMPNRRALMENGYLFADGDYVGFTGWPGMAMTLSQDGWLGIAPSDREITLRSLDFWRCEHDMIRENWVLIDLLSAYDQLGVDVLARMRELTKARYLAFEA